MWKKKANVITNQTLYTITAQRPRSYGYFHIFPSMQGASEMHIEQTNNYLPSNLLAFVHWGKHCRHPSELCELRFSKIHYMKDKEHDDKYPEIRDSQLFFSKHMHIDENSFDGSSSGHKLLDSHWSCASLLPDLSYFENAASMKPESSAHCDCQRKCAV